MDFEIIPSYFFKIYNQFFLHCILQIGLKEGYNCTYFLSWLILMWFSPLYSVNCVQVFYTCILVLLLPFPMSAHCPRPIADGGGCESQGRRNGRFRNSPPCSWALPEQIAGQRCHRWAGFPVCQVCDRRGWAFETWAAAVLQQQWHHHGAQFGGSLDTCREGAQGHCAWCLHGWEQLRVLAVWGPCQQSAQGWTPGLLVQREEVSHASHGLASLRCAIVMCSTSPILSKYMDFRLFLGMQQCMHIIYRYRCGYK